MLNNHHNRQLVREFVRQIDPDLNVQFAEDEFYVYIHEQLINVSFNGNPMGNRLYKEFVEEHFGVSVDPFITGLLHEIGHIFTYDPELDRNRAIEYFLLQCSFNEEDVEAYTKMYFAIPAEYNATKWGVEYYLTCKDFCDEFLSKLED